MMVRLTKMRDNFGQQRRGRTDGAIRSLADRRPMGKDPSLAPETAEASLRRQTAAGGRQSARRHFVDSAERRSLAGFARRIPLTGNLLAAASGLGRAGSLADHLARIPGGTEPTRATRLERIVSGWQFCSGKKGGSEVGKTKRGKGTKWMVVVDVASLESQQAAHPGRSSTAPLQENTTGLCR